MSDFILLYLNVMYGDFAGQGTRDFCLRIKDGEQFHAADFQEESLCRIFTSLLACSALFLSTWHPQDMVQGSRNIRAGHPYHWGKKPNQSHALLHSSPCSLCSPPFWMLALHVLPALESHHVFNVFQVVSVASCLFAKSLLTLLHWKCLLRGSLELVLVWCREDDNH